ncbi:uncharacterized protein L201_005510 [Kwoniella dendrophila CBS 6074]|uniref:Killer toxin Kp4 domain-containing protein n=1 Tax=Kwoniella dendrophila CBS 6074 TaxID=1295534 RepID=A0AAX4K094_9TREE
MFTKSNFLIGAAALGMMGLSNAQADWSDWQAAALNALVSDKCQKAIKTTFSADSDIGKCNLYDQIDTINDTATSNSFLSRFCDLTPCSNDVLKAGSQDIWNGWSTELGYSGVTQEDIVDELFASYSLQREIVCLKTDEDYCLTEFSNKLATSNIDFTSINYGNLTSDQIKEFTKEYLCDSCIIASIDLIEQQYPELTSYDLGQGKSLDEYFNDVCDIKVSTDGTLPQGITRSAKNSTFPNTNGLAKRLLRKNIGNLKRRFISFL